MSGEVVFNGPETNPATAGIDGILQKDAGAITNATVEIDVAAGTISAESGGEGFTAPLSAWVSAPFEAPVRGFDARSS
jgi:hypothetical protein